MPANEIAFCDLRLAHLERAAAIEQVLLRVARSGRYVLGPELEAFEAEFAHVCGVRHAVGVGSGTAALTLILRASGIGPGDEVLVPAYTAAATWMAVALAGAQPVGVDVDPASGLIDPAAAGAAVGPRTRALIAVHLFGRLAPMGELRRLADSGGLLLIEDAAHAAGVDEGDGPAGSLGDAAAFSFYPTKPLGALGDGGAVTCADSGRAEEVRRLRSYGWTEWQGQAERVGGNSRLDEIQAAVLRVSLAAMPQMHRRLRALAAVLRGALGEVRGLELPPAPPGIEPPWHQFLVRVANRSEVRAALARRGVGSAMHYEPLPPMLEAFGSQRGRFPHAEQLARHALSLPFDAWLTEVQMEQVAEGLRDAVASSERPVT